MSLIELAIQRAKADSAKGNSAEKPVAHGGQPSNSGGSLRQETVTAGERAAEVLNPDIVITDAFLRQRGMLAAEAQDHQQRAEYRQIKYGLVREAVRAESRGPIFVTSALQGEGKSFSSLHLALSMASEQDHTVVLVDADSIRPSLSRTLGCEDRPGLMNALADTSANVESMLMTTSVRGLSFLPAGRHDERATEHFASARMNDLLKQLLSVPNRIVIVDTLPLLLTTESRALASLGGQIVLVVRAESTPQSAVMEALDLLGEGANVKLLLNAAVRSKGMEYYGMGSHGFDYATRKEPTP